MNEIYDKFIIRVFFTLLICLAIILYRFAHLFLYPMTRQQVLQKFYPDKNPAASIHLFAKILGIGIIFSSFNISLSDNLLISIIDFIIQYLVVLILYLLSVYIMESVVLYNFEYYDEIVKRKNIPYAIISMGHAITVAYLINTIQKAANSQLMALFFLWSFAMVFLGIAVKIYPYLSPLHFNKLLIQKSMGLALSYCGFLAGCGIIIASAFGSEFFPNQYKSYSIHLVLKLILSVIFIPFFRFGIIQVYRITGPNGNFSRQLENADDPNEGNLGHGIYEGVLFFTSCILTSVITSNLNFHQIYLETANNFTTH